MDLKLNGKVALVTAASGGIGKAVAQELAKEKANVIICSRDQERIQRAVDEIVEQTGQQVTPFVADVANADDINSLVTAVERQFGRIDVLVCNAGGPPSGPFMSFDDAAWQSAFETNVMSVVRLVRATVPLMKDGGRILTVASSSVKVPISGLVLSNVMRAGVAGLMKTLANELASAKILVNTICPGRIATDRLAELDSARAAREGRSVADVQAEIEAEIPLQRFGEPEEFARVAVFLASEANTYVTGSTIMVDGGFVKAL